MKLAVFSHKPCWRSGSSPTGYATDGGFPFQMRALSELFDSTRLVVPVLPEGSRAGEVPLQGRNLSVFPLAEPAGSTMVRKAVLPLWLLRYGISLLRQAREADAIHTPIPGDIGTFGMLLALALRKPLFVRHCGNWLVQKTAAERIWKWSMERFAGGRNVMLATGGASEPPSKRNPNVSWIFSTTLTEQELQRCRVVPRVPSNPVRLVIACRQELHKGTDVALRSLQAVRARLPGATLDVVGDGSALPSLRRLAVELGVKDCVRFHGRVGHDGVLGLMRQADLFCYPTSASEGFPKVVVEALACGLPVVTTPVSVLPQVIATGCGVLLSSTTPEETARAVVSVLGDPSRYQAMSARALETAAQYTLERWRDTIGERLRAAWGPLPCAS